MKRYRLHCQKSGRFIDRGLVSIEMVERAARRMGFKAWWVEEIA